MRPVETQNTEIVTLWIVRNVLVDGILKVKAKRGHPGLYVVAEDGTVYDGNDWVDSEAKAITIWENKKIERMRMLHKEIDVLARQRGPSITELRMGKK